MEHSPYPDEETLATLSVWPSDRASALPPALATEWIAPYGKVAETQPGLWVFATGGWSGNEELLASARASAAWRLLHWQSLYLPGGLLVVAVSPAAELALDRELDRVTRWAWGAER